MVLAPKSGIKPGVPSHKEQVSIVMANSGNHRRLVAETTEVVCAGFVVGLKLQTLALVVEHITDWKYRALRAEKIDELAHMVCRNRSPLEHESPPWSVMYRKRYVGAPVICPIKPPW